MCGGGGREGGEGEKDNNLLYGHRHNQAYSHLEESEVSSPRKYASCSPPLFLRLQNGQCLRVHSLVHDIGSILEVSDSRPCN